MARKTADLGSYIERCYYTNVGLSCLRERMVDQGITHQRPRLVKGRVNRILLYPGCFNPPHRSHEALLHYAFTNCQDMNVVAAIVLPLDDDDVDAKNHRAGDGLVLTKDERVRLWRGHGPHDWRWVYDRTIEEWYSFRHNLTEAVSRDGFNLKFTLLAGPDYIKRDSTMPWNAWNCEEIVTSDIGRAADFAIANHLLQLPDCEPWEPVAWSNDTLAHYVEASAAFLAGGLSLLAPKLLKEEMERGERCFDITRIVVLGVDTRP